MNSKYFSFVADYIPHRGQFPIGKRWVDLTIKSGQGDSEPFALNIEEAPLLHGELYSFRIKSRATALPGSLFLTADAVALVDWSSVHDIATGGAVLTLPPGEEIP